MEGYWFVSSCDCQFFRGREKKIKATKTAFSTCEKECASPQQPEESIGHPEPASESKRTEKHWWALLCSVQKISAFYEMKTRVLAFNPPKYALLGTSPLSRVRSGLRFKQKSQRDLPDFQWMLQKVRYLNLYILLLFWYSLKNIALRFLIILRHLDSIFVKCFEILRMFVHPL